MHGDDKNLLENYKHFGKERKIFELRKKFI